MSLDSRHLRSTGAILAVVATTTLGGQVSIPLQEVPGTLQTLAVLVGASLLGARRASFAMAIYLALGLCGVPVFHDWRSMTPFEFTQYPAAGYLFGFLVAAAIVGLLAQRERNLLGWTLLLVVGHLIILACGVPVLIAWSNWETGLTAGFLVLLPGMAAKSILGGLLAYWVRRRLARNTASKLS